MEDKTPYPLNPHCKKANIYGSKASNRWMVYFNYLDEGKRKMFRYFKGLNKPNQSLSYKRRNPKSYQMK